MMILLAGAANLVCVSYDTDDDEDTPPITVELNLLTPSRKNLHVPQLQSARFSPHRDDKPLTELHAGVQFEAIPLLSKSSPQLVVPLRR
jgi:hypothetical protein